jgi:hypothetical protein
VTLRKAFLALIGAPAAVALAVATASCGRRATAQDCQLIVDRSVELQVRESGGDPAEAAKREDAVRAQLESELKACEGRRVTERTMRCVQGAKSSRELDDCLR